MNYFTRKYYPSETTLQATKNNKILRKLRANEYHSNKLATKFHRQMEYLNQTWYNER